MSPATAAPDVNLLADSTGPVTMNISATIGGDTYLNLSVWKLKSGGPEQFNLGVLTVGPDMHEISTVVGGPTKGSGTATVTRSGAGGVIAVGGTDASGAAVKLNVNCARFDPIAEEGGR